ncbi:MAG: hypothetical protein J6U06_11350 [Spirochaetaceae bacterium]|nr:hypothetical protein [Spirochaetaceae bacterium]
MKKFLFVLISCFLVFSLFADEVHESFELYREAILAGDGEMAVQYLNQASIDYYDDLLKAALYLKESEFEKRTILDKMMILRLRMNFTAKELKNMNGRELIVYSIQKGWIGKSSVVNIELSEETKIKGDWATIEVLQNGQGSDLNFIFQKENDIWKLDINEIFKITNMTLAYFVQQSDYTEKEFIEIVLESADNKKVQKSHYKPMLKK